MKPSRALLFIFLAFLLGGGAALWISQPPSLPHPHSPVAQSKLSTEPMAPRLTPSPESVAHSVEEPAKTNLVMPGAPLVRTVGSEPELADPAVEVPSVQGSRSSPEAEVAIENVRLMFRDYRSRVGGNPVGTNAEMMKAVMGGNPANARLGPPEGQRLNGEGELLDHWGSPYFFHQLSAEVVEIRSAGPDRILWNEDDLLVR